MRKKRAFTLLEIMIVIFLIGLIGSVVGYNMKGSMDEGRAFKTKQARMKIQDIFELEIAKGVSPNEIIAAPKKYLQASGIANNPSKLLKDGWGEDFRFNLKIDGSIKIHSKKYSAWKKSKTKMRGRDLED